jgi:hypothetical protein
MVLRGGFVSDPSDRKDERMIGDAILFIEDR